MNEKKLRLIHTVCGIFVSVALIVAAICLINASNAIYNSGDKPYTPESVSAAYAKIAIPLWVADFAVLAGIIKAPSYYSPFASIENCLNRRNTVLSLMLEQKIINKLRK